VVRQLLQVSKLKQTTNTQHEFRQSLANPELQITLIKNLSIATSSDSITLVRLEGYTLYSFRVLSDNLFHHMPDAVLYVLKLHLVYSFLFFCFILPSLEIWMLYFCTSTFRAII